MGSMKVPSHYHGNPNLINFETDMDLQQWTVLHKQTSNISSNNSANVIEEKDFVFQLMEHIHRETLLKRHVRNYPKKFHLFR